MVSIVNILSGALPLMVDVRQSGGSPDLIVADADGESFAAGGRRRRRTSQSDDEQQAH
jgi:hypothetical protein